jgi:hypothetical protein
MFPAADARIRRSAQATGPAGFFAPASYPQ